MDCLARRKTAGRTTGDVRVNGHPQLFSTFARVSGYCEQASSPRRCLQCRPVPAEDRPSSSSPRSKSLVRPVSPPSCGPPGPSRLLPIDFPNAGAQNDIHSPQATVREALWFSARLRLGPEVSNGDCARFISEVWRRAAPPPPPPLALPASLRSASASCSAFARGCLEINL